MVLLTNPQTADLQQRIQNSRFGSPDYLQGFTGTMPGYQQNLLANNFQPGLITRDFSGAGTSLDGSGVANYLSYTPGVPPQAVNNSTFLPLNTMVNAAVRQGGGGGGGDRGPMQNLPDPTYNPNLLGAYIGYNNPDYEASPYGEDANVLGDFIEAIQRKKVSTPYGAAQERATAADQANTAANQRNLARETGGGAGQDTSGPEASGSGAVGSTGPTARSRGGW